jgi:hypothetical protein
MRDGYLPARPWLIPQSERNLLPPQHIATAWQLVIKTLVIKTTAG